MGEDLRKKSARVNVTNGIKKLHVGDHIQATVVVLDPGYYVTDVKVVPKK